MSEERELSYEPHVAAGEQCIALTADFRLTQKLRGHRYSVDDMLVAHLAATQDLTPRRVLDLGCGLGSVLLIMAWAFRRASFIGVEALEEHVHYARRNVALNRCQSRVRIVKGDLRDASLLDPLGRFDLITGSPPYFLPGSGTLCADPARAAAHFELRGGIEDYAQAATRCLAPHGLFACCASAAPPQRATAAFEDAGLTTVFRQPVVPREGKAPFLLLLVGQKPHQAPCPDAPALVLRQADGLRTAEHIAIREWTGLP
ncbi:MAG: methyltransferase domain-containing protein [Deltaproteobacteria bacterium]|nr:methyltransferase domain-containing protein [Deltaproteobacteria bacterium]